MNIPIYMLPGTATDQRMFMPQLEQFSQIIVPEWLPPMHRKEPLEDYAKRLSACINTSRPFWIGGVSLGGMLAQEVAHHIKPLGVILIATCTSSKALPLIWRLNGKLTRMMPDLLVKWMLRFMGFIVRHTSRLPHKELYAEMLKEMPPALVRWQSGAATEWKGNRILTMPVFQIHGARDVVIPLGNVHPDRVIEKGGHLINVTHPHEVNGFIASCVESQPDEADIRKIA